MRKQWVSCFWTILLICCSVEESPSLEISGPVVDKELDDHQGIGKIGDCFGFFLSGENFVTLTSCTENQDSVWLYRGSDQWEPRSFTETMPHESGVAVLRLAGPTTPFPFEARMDANFPTRVKLHLPGRYSECDALSDGTHFCWSDRQSKGAPLVNVDGYVIGIQFEDTKKDDSDCPATRFCARKFIPADEWFLE